MSNILVKVADGRRAVTPRGDDVPAGLFRVNKNDPYWARALRAGDLIVAAEKTATKITAQAVQCVPSRKEEKSDA
ncbi:hypothetical protein GT348_07235 [Aristophania vespae]|uniref:DUF2635 domain-containing protein n=1 Tax=Aristophania vespae TaxID=2697033 RepID=A0A6P1NCL6_9PROT|nr:hypothetical protein [Aristophania vespae]QHI96056.1 hypothetical protein GT348_07235 [Aristophania vespae]